MSIEIQMQSQITPVDAVKKENFFFSSSVAAIHGIYIYSNLYTFAAIYGYLGRESIYGGHVRVFFSGEIVIMHQWTC
jgi:hypothetical protein